MKLDRYADNPILAPLAEHHWEAGAVFNAGASIGPDGRVYMLYRAIDADYHPFPDRPGYANYVSRLGLAISDDGKQFERKPAPVMVPEDGFDPYGCEDPRVNAVSLDGFTTWLITYSALHQPAYSGDHVRIGLAQTNDFKQFRKLGTVGPDVFDRNAVFFPDRIDGKLALIHRVGSDIQIAYFDDLEHLLDPEPDFWPDYLAKLDDHKLLTQVYPWEAKKIGAGCPPIQTPEGWLLIYHGVDADHVYRAGIALLNLDDPQRVIARSSEPILAPEADYERVGDVPNVVFPQGLVILDGVAHVYYGGADKVVALATAPLNDIVSYLVDECRL